MLIKKVVKEIVVFGKLFQTIEFGNHGNKQNCIKGVFDTYKEGGDRNIGFWKII